MAEETQLATQVTPAAQPEQTVAPKPEPQGKKKKSEAPVEGLALMRKPFSANQISILCKSTSKNNEPGRCPVCKGWHKLPAVQLSYVGHAALTDRLLDADPSWTWEPLSLAPDGTPFLDANGGMWIKLTVCGVSRFRNAAMRFGAALDLWHKGGDLHSDQSLEEKAAGENEAEQLAKFQEREAKQPPAEIEKPKVREGEGWVVLTKIVVAKSKNGEYWKMHVTDVNDKQSQVAVWDSKLKTPELWNAAGKDLKIKIGSKTSGDKTYYNLLAIHQIGSQEIKPTVEETPQWDDEV
jgi:hypothetical protein